MNNCCELSYNKIYTKATLCCKISNVNGNYDAVKFGEWLTDAFNRSRFKSWEDVANQVKPVRGGTRSTLSRYAGAKPQLLTDKPSQPKAELALKLAEVFGEDVNKVLMLAGHAPNSASDFDSKVLVAFQDAKGLPLAELDKLLDSVRTFVAGVRAEQATRENK